ncbi:MAG: hypothetical protein WC928_03980 [Patescibacteria group bacterium]|jgi:hypothetical protein
MNIFFKNKKLFGFGSLELLLAGSIFILLLTSITGLLLYGRDSLDKDNLSSRASLLANEGLTAVENIRQVSFDNLIDGVHGLYFSGGEWGFLGSYDEKNDFRRTVTISSLSPTEKRVAIEIIWPKKFGRLGRVLLVKHFSKWPEVVLAPDFFTDINIDTDIVSSYCATVTVSTDSITPVIWSVDIDLSAPLLNGIPYSVTSADWSFASSTLTAWGLPFNETVASGSPAFFEFCSNRPQNQADYLIVNTINTYVGSGNPGNRNVYDIYLGNNGIQDIILSSINLGWTNTPVRRLQQIFIDGTSIWSGNINSGGTAVISGGYVLVSGSGPYNLRLRFNNDFSGRTINYINFNFLDGSTKTIGPISL